MLKSVSDNLPYYKKIASHYVYSDEISSEMVSGLMEKIRKFKPHQLDRTHVKKTINRTLINLCYNFISGKNREVSKFQNYIDTLFEPKFYKLPDFDEKEVVEGKLLSELRDRDQFYEEFTSDTGRERSAELIRNVAEMLLCKPESSIDRNLRKIKSARFKVLIDNKDIIRFVDIYIGKFPKDDPEIVLYLLTGDIDTLLNEIIKCRKNEKKRKNA